MMTLEEFHRLADTWGGDIERWPAQRRIEARQYAATEEGAAILASAQRLDALLASPSDVAPEREARAAFAVLQRIAEQGEATGQGSWWFAGGRLPTWLMPAASVTGSALIGVSLATMMPYGGSDEHTIVLSAILDSGSMAASWVTR